MDLMEFVIGETEDADWVWNKYCDFKITLDLQVKDYSPSMIEDFKKQFKEDVHKMKI